jgi:hypothetical protein
MVAILAGIDVAGWARCSTYVYVDIYYESKCGLLMSVGLVGARGIGKGDPLLYLSLFILEGNLTSLFGGGDFYRLGFS